MPSWRRLVVSLFHAGLLSSCEREPVSDDVLFGNRAVYAQAGAAADPPAERIWRVNAGGMFPSEVHYPAGTGTLTTLLVSESVDTAGHAFFTSLGTNGRACITCHQPADGMGLSAATARQLWEETQGADPLFAMVDGANCPSLPASDPASHSLLLERGLIRIPRPWPPLSDDGTPIQPEISIAVVRDPTGCNTDPVYGLESAKPTVSVFRRPRPAANLKYATEIGFSFDPKNGLPLVLDRATGQPTSGNLLADVRQRTLSAQALDALFVHTERTAPPTAAQLQQILDFETRIYTAQSFDSRAGDLTVGAQGGPRALADAPAARLQSTASNPIWGEFAAWAEPPDPVDPPTGPLDPQLAHRRSIARGAKLFAGRQFLVTDSTGINDTGFGNPVRNSCAFCHNMLHAGLDVAPGQVDLGTTNFPHATWVWQPDLPLFEVTCKPDAPEHPYLGRVVLTHDPGYALTTGKCIDIGKITAQSMRGIAARAPYFANGSAKTLADVIEFYDQRYEMQLTEEEKLDLLHLLEVL
ncbi:MAG: hypothetical protein ABW321_11705 [Polyangiales bacterium]